jgi:hypothetical protein
MYKVLVTARRLPAPTRAVTAAVAQADREPDEVLAPDLGWGAVVVGLREGEPRCSVR